MVRPERVKTPPAYKFPAESNAKALTVEFEPSKPSPKGDQLLPFHFAILIREIEPERVKFPPAYKFPAYNAKALTVPFKPSPKDDQIVPSHFTILFADIDVISSDCKAFVKIPPIYKVLLE